VSQQTKLIGAGAALLVSLVFFVRGCGQYAEVNEVTYEHAKALYSVCNRRDSERLEVCETLIVEAAANQQLSRRETSYLTDIIDTARNGEWVEALAMSRQLMEDQVQH